MYAIVTVVRDIVTGAFFLSAALATSHWLVRTQKISPFSWLGRFLKKSSDPVLAPVETRVVRFGGLPSHAGWWLVVGTAVAGILLVWVSKGVVSVLYDMRYAAEGGVFGVASYLLNGVIDILIIALVVRFFGGLLGAFQFNRWTRWAYVLTNWMIEPIAKVLPTYANVDWSPLAAFILLMIIKAIL
ncbi:MAG TPA: YggT family protein [Gemmatimonadales bacterium]|jgi:YggT family protein|nr:YggT family protein [Gemmatimonadales bacterium]